MELPLWCEYGVSHCVTNGSGHSSIEIATGEAHFADLTIILPLIFKLGNNFANII